MRSPVARRMRAGAIVGASASVLVLGLDAVLVRGAGSGWGQPLTAIELKTDDWRLARTAQPTSALTNISLVEIDEYSLRNLQPNAGRWPWPRVVHAELLDYLARAPAKVIAYDIDFAEPDTRLGF